MEFWQGLVVVTFVHLLAAASPGPDFALVVRQSIQHGRNSGLWTSLGISLGLSVHIIYSIAGLAAIVAHSAHWMIMIKLAGGVYLLYLGIKGLLSKEHQAEQKISTTVSKIGSPQRYIITGFFCNALNPKAPIYFLSLFTVILSPDMSLPTLVIYGGWIMFLQMFWFSTLAFLLTKKAIRGRLLSAGHWIDRIFGVAMIALGYKVLNSTTK
jgi:threonine/homoserine/homoserine lactone efflux protein